jgi:hypothetical protein
VGHFSIVKWVLFRLTKTDNGLELSGPAFILQRTSPLI